MVVYVATGFDCVAAPRLHLAARHLLGAGRATGV